MCASGLARINVWIAEGNCPCKISNRDWIVQVFDCYNKVLEWCDKKYDNIIARCGHVELELPPGCYVIHALLSLHEKRGSYNCTQTKL